jgi:hypothetical protein
MLVKSGGDNGVGFNEATQSWLRGHSVTMISLGPRAGVK